MINTIDSYGAVLGPVSAAQRTANVAAVQTALNDLASSNGPGALRFNGNVEIDSTIDLPAMARRAIVSDGGTFGLIQYGNAVPILRMGMTNTHTIIVDGMHLDYATQQHDPAAVALDFHSSGSPVSAYHWTIRNLSSNCAAVGVGFTGTGEVSLWNSSLDSAFFSAVGISALNLASPTPVGSPILRITKLGVSNTNTPVNLLNTGACVTATAAELSLYGADIEGWNNQVFNLGGSYCFRVDDVHLENNQLTADTYAVMCYTGATSTLLASNWSIAGNRVTGQQGVATLFNLGNTATNELDAMTVKLTVDRQNSLNFVGANYPNSPVLLRNIVDKAGTCNIPSNPANTATVNNVRWW